MNVIGSRPDGWWRDRDAAARAFIDRLQRYAPATGSDVIVVLDGRPLHDRPEGELGNVRLLYGGSRAHNAADDRIVAFVEADEQPVEIVVVTADRALIARVEALGATVRSPSSLRRDLDALAPP